MGRGPNGDGKASPQWLSKKSTTHRSKAVVQGRRSPVRRLKGASGRVDAVSRGRREIVRRRPDRSTIGALLFPRHFFLPVVERSTSIQRQIAKASCRDGESPSV